MDFSECVNDNVFGPTVQGCRGDFDFTLEFEKIFFSIIPSSTFVALALTRMLLLSRKPLIVGGRLFQGIKLVATAVYAAIQLALLVLVATKITRLTAYFISSSALAFVAALCMSGLSFLEHSRSPRPSILLGTFLFLTILFDIAQTRSLWLSARSYYEISYVRLFTAGTACKTLLIVLESWKKQRWLQWDLNDHSPEETVGMFGLGAFWWLNSLFISGYNKVLALSDLFALDTNMASETLQRSFAKQIARADFKNDRDGLAKALARTLAFDLLLPVAPRVALTGFTFCQPFLLSTLLTYLEEPASETSVNTGYGLIGATVLVYSGIAIVTAFYWYFHERVLWKARGCLCAVVYKKTTESGLSAAADSAALTLMSTDLEKIRQGFIQMYEFLANPIEVALAAWLLYRQLGAAFAAPIIVVVVCVLLIILVARIAGPRQRLWMAKIQKRVGLTSNVIANMKHLRISGLSGPVEDAIQQTRVDEIATGSKFRMIIIWSAVISFTPMMLAPVFTFAVTSRTLDVTTIYTSVSFLLLLSNPLSILFQFVPNLLSGFVCLRRIQSYLDKETYHDFRQVPEAESDEKAAVSKQNSSAPAIQVTNGGFGWQEDKMALREINISVPQSSLTIVVGPIASGKSTLCKALLGETPFSQGQLVLNTKFGRVGYCDQTPFLSNATIRENIIGYSPFDETRYAAIIEATKLSTDLALLPQGDRSKVGSNGISLSGGQKQRVSIARALYVQSDLLIFDDILSGLDADTEEQVFIRVFGPTGLIKQRGATTVLCTHSVRHLPSADHIIALSNEGTVVEEGNFEALLANRKYVHSLGIKVNEDSGSSRSGMSTPPPIEDDKEIIRLQIGRAKTAESLAATVAENTSARQLGDTTVYKHYFASIGIVWTIAFIMAGVCSGFFYNWPNVWFTFWSNDVTSAHPKHTNSFYVGLYALFQCAALASMFSMIMIAFQTLIRLSGTVLHKAALHTVITAPLRFFTTTDAGVVTNLFSQDMTLIDNDLPNALLNVVLELFLCIGLAAVVATSSPYIIISYPVVALVLFAIQKFYLRTSRQLRLLNLEAKSPLYTHFTDTIKGVATFRAFGWVQDAVLVNHDLLDTSQRPAYLLAMIQRWLAFVLNLVVAAIALLIVCLATQLRSNSGFTGASLVSLMTFGDFLTHLVQMYTALETSIGAVARLRTFSENTKPEDLPEEDVVPPESWPQKGRIEIKGVSASYGEIQSETASESESNRLGTPNALALKNLILTIEPGQKVAICGRSGSGKSSTILLLLRLLEPLPSDAAKMTIDGTPLNIIDRSTLRERIIAVPQDAIFLPDGTSFKANLDPFTASNHAECRAVLETVDLWTFVAERGGLEAGMTPDTLSQGQKQLFSLARAILRRRVRARGMAAEVGDVYLTSEKSPDFAAGGGVLLLDEVSSSVDIETDRAMQRIIQEEFSGYTIVMVSHRLDMVLEFDRVLVMDAGRVVEQGRPRELVEAEGSRFRDLWLVGNRE